MSDLHRNVPPGVSGLRASGLIAVVAAGNKENRPAGPTGSGAPCRSARRADLTAAVAIRLLGPDAFADAGVVAAVLRIDAGRKPRLLRYPLPGLQREERCHARADQKRSDTRPRVPHDPPS